MSVMASDIKHKPCSQTKLLQCVNVFDDALLNKYVRNDVVLGAGC